MDAAVVAIPEASADNDGTDEAEDGRQGDVERRALGQLALGVRGRAGPRGDVDHGALGFVPLAAEDGEQGAADVLRALVVEGRVGDGDSHEAESSGGPIRREGRRFIHDFAGGFVDVVPDDLDGRVGSVEVLGVPRNCERSVFSTAYSGQMGILLHVHVQ